MTQPPQKIYLQWHNPDHDLGVMWCPDQIHGDDVEYVQADHVARLEHLVRIADAIMREKPIGVPERLLAEWREASCTQK